MREGRATAGPGAAGRHVIVILATLLIPRPLVAQLVPGTNRGGDAAREYQAYIIRNVTELMSDWGSAWSADDRDALVDLYTEDAVLMPPEGNTIHGRDALAEHFRQLIPATTGVTAAVADFDARGAMAYASGTYSYGIRRGSTTVRRTGTHVTVMVREGNTWLIRLQTFVPDPPDPLEGDAGREPPG